MIRSAGIAAAITPSGSTDLTGRPSNSPPSLWKYHHGMPFCSVTTAVPGPNIAGTSAASAPTCCALSASRTKSCGPASAVFCTARTLLATCSVPSSSISRKPRALIACRFAPRAMKVTSSPASARRAPRYPPIDPAPTPAIFIGSASCLPVLVAQRADPVDRHLDHVAGRGEDHVADREVLALAAVDQRAHGGP